MKDMNVNDLKDKVASLSHAEQQPVYSKNETGFVEMTGFKGIYNLEHAEWDGVVSKDYTLVQHEAAFAPVVEAIGMAGLADFKGEVRENHGSAWINLAFPTIRITPPDGKEVFLGFRACNSYGATGAIRLEGYGMRMCCANQMRLRNLLTKMKVVHKGEAEVMVRKIQEYILGIQEQIPALEAAFQKAAMKKLIAEEAKMLMVNNKIGSRRADAIMEKFKDEEQTAWGLYNAITNVASHELADKPLIQDRLLLAAEVILRCK